MPFRSVVTGNNAPISSGELRTRFEMLSNTIANLPRSPELMSSIANHAAGLVAPITPLSLKFSEPPTQREVEAIALKLNELIAALKRAKV